MKVKITKDEWYPVLEVSDCHRGMDAELTEQEVDRIRAALKEFEACQDLIQEGMRRVS